MNGNKFILLIFSNFFMKSLKSFACLLLVMSFVLFIPFKSNGKARLQNISLVIDTTRTVILLLNKEYGIASDDAYTADLIENDLVIIDSMMKRAIDSFNAIVDITELSPLDIGLKTDYKINLNDYYSQYMAFYDSSGQKYVWINCFCDSYLKSAYHSDWKKTVINVDDGGSCFFHLTINLTQQTWSKFYINASIP